MLLLQDEAGTEQMLIRDLSRAISEKLEQTIFSNA
jgi:hypothetical protein